MFGCKFISEIVKKIICKYPADALQSHICFCSVSQTRDHQEQPNQTHHIDRCYLFWYFSFEDVMLTGYSTLLLQLCHAVCAGFCLELLRFAALLFSP